MQIWAVKTDWATECETGSSVGLYATKELAQTAFEKEVSEELIRYDILDGNIPDGYKMEKTEDYFEIYLDGEYLLNHSTISLELLPVIDK